MRLQAPVTAQREHAVPLYLTSSFVFDSAEQARALFADELPGNIYSRYSNPNTDEFIAKLCALEGAADGIATASGMAAVFASLAAILSHGDHVVASRALFGSTHQLFTKVLPRWGITSDYADLGDSAQFAALVKPNTKAIFIETPSNPGLAVGDLDALGRLARERGLVLIVDNCFSTPVLQALSPFNAWVLSKSLETLHVRMEAHCRNALALASHFEGSADLEAVRYPGLPSHPQHALAMRQMTAGGGIVVLVVTGGLERARRFLDALDLVSHSPNLGDTRTIVTHPTSTTHSKLTEAERQAVGIVPGLVRVSVGLEHVGDVIADIERALVRSR
ncbi:MAG: aminotransferase class I/II-fold pyridoxal phosphate-dependent enzyme [Gemmatimonadetes bacterium]|nr:aminotransferase class I/II-fold pyridoxal phosphate-dependent enzyme [Gemmatimonadota bacterium]